ncbi:MAG: S1 RNA-binding domain-containing protein [Chloroflexi bacterium]|nr:S1 RNA-binding domain-containing protein [Chloroflexota bacterium]
MTSEDPEGGTLDRDEPQSMAALLEQETTPYTELRRGDIVEGAVVGTDRDGILVDIGAKSEGVIPANEMHSLQPEGASKLQMGEKVLVFVVQPESPDGQIILSLDRARGEQGWRVLQEYMDQNQAFEGYVTGSNKGGLLVNVEGVNSFIPLSQIAIGRPERGDPETTEKALAEWIGRTLTLKVIELNRRRNRAIVSERAAMQEKRAAEKERLLQELNEGDIRNGSITSIRDFGIFVDVGGADGLVHLSELSWERTPKSPNDLFNVGDEVEVYVLKVDQESKKIALSLRRAQPEKWEEMVAGFREGQIVPGQVTKLAPFGAFVRLDGPIEGLIHISELVDRRINHPKEIVDEDGVVPVKIVRIEHDRHRLGLSLRQARDKAEEDGWVFNDCGGVITGPEEVYAKLGVVAPPRPEPEAAAEKPEAEAEPALGTMEAAMKAAEAEAGEAAEPEAAAAEESETEEATESETEAGAEETAAVEEPETEAEAEEAAEPETEEATESETEAGAEETAAVEEPETEAEAGEAAEPEAAAAEEPETEEATESETEPEAAAAEEPETEEATESETEPEAAAAEEPETEEATESETEAEAGEAAEPQSEAKVEEVTEAEATAEEAGEEEAETASESEIEDEPTVTEDTPDALNKVKDASAEVETEADEGAEPAKDETSD